jgi:hypothetical protein
MGTDIDAELARKLCYVSHTKGAPGRPVEILLVQIGNSGRECFRSQCLLKFV